MAKNKRDCPALGQLISSARCGEERGSVIACPEDCAFYPFGRPNYDQYAELEARLIHKCMRRFVEESGVAAMERLQRVVARLGGNQFLEYAEAARLQFFERDAAGHTLVDRWQEARFAGLNQDEQRILRGMAGTRLSFLEIHRQIDDHTVEGMDLLDPDPQPVLVVDHALAGHWARFSTYLAWTYDAPHYRRMSGGAMEVADLGDADPAEGLTAIVAHLGGPGSLCEAKGWMTGNIKLIVDSLDASRAALREAMLSGMDLRFCKARYRWANRSGRDSLIARLRTALNLVQGTLSDDEREEGWAECWDAIAPAVRDAMQEKSGSSAASIEAPEEVIQGSLLLGDQGVLLETSTGAGYEWLKPQFEAMAGSSVIFESERVDDFASQLRQRNRVPYDPALVPPALLARPKNVSFRATRGVPDETSQADPATDFVRHHYSDFADRPIVLLDHRTPRQAAADPALRPRLVRLMKRHLHGLDRNVQKVGEAPDIGWLLQDLGLEEINFPPPPARDAPDEEWDEDDEDDFTRTGDAGGVEDEDEDEDDESSFESAFSPADWDYDPSVVEVPAPGRVLTLEDVAARVSNLASECERDVKPAGIVTAIAAWPGFFETCSPLTGALSKDEFYFLVMHFYQAAAVLHPVPPSGSRLNPGRVLHYFEEEERRMATLLEQNPKSLPDEAFVGDCPQPEVAQWLTEVVLDLTEGVQKPNRLPKPPMMLRFSSAILILCFLRAGIRELCHWPVR